MSRHGERGEGSEIVRRPGAPGGVDGSLEAVVVPASLDGERVDRVVALLTGLPRAEVARLVAGGGASLDGAPVTSRHHRVTTGQHLEFLVPEPAAAGSALEAEPEVGDGLVVVHEDAALVVVDKPAGLVVHPGAGHRRGTLAGGLLARYPELEVLVAAGVGQPDRPGIVHRLDKDTSGLLAVARTAEAFASLTAQLADRSMGRTYLTVVRGEVAADEGVVEGRIGRSGRDPTRMAVTAGGREARTHYRVLERLGAGEPVTLLEVRLETGRTHQIRVHLAAIGHPVLGDPRYGGRQVRPGERPFLHAARLRLVHPVDGEPREFVSPLPGDLEALLGQLRAPG